MQLLDSEILRFKQLYKDHFGIDISKEEATEQASGLVNLMKAIYKPIPIKDVDEDEYGRVERQL